MNARYALSAKRDKMSFTNDVIAELMTAQCAKTCCRKAMLFGLFCTGSLDAKQKHRIYSEFRSPEIAGFAADILHRQFAADAEITQLTRAGRRVCALSAISKAIAAFLSAFDNAEDERSLDELINFRCPECRHAFLRGAFIASGTLNDPQKGYHLEFCFHNELRAEKLRRFLCAVVPEPRTVKRGARTGVYYKSNEAIFDILNYVGGGNLCFLLSDIYIERDIRNAENRATNCVAHNISKSVDASMKQIEAIRALIDSQKILSLPKELRYTAELRLENPSASLFELSHMHEPPISKSGLNRRLSRLIEEAEGINE